MSSIIQQKYISFISSTLDRFKWIQPNKVANCRCNICGDSEKSEYKARGYFYLVQKFDTFMYKCQNCGASMGFRNYLKLYFPHYYQELKLEEFVYTRENTFQENPKTKEPDYISAVKVTMNFEKELITPITKLDKDHPAVQYIISRQIPKDKYQNIYYTANFKEFVHSYQEVDNRKYPEDERIVFLMKDKEGNIFGAQGRSLDPKAGLRYVTVKFDDNLPKIFGLDTVNTKYPIIVTEGVIDGFFLPNCVSICGGDIGESLKAVDVPFSQFIVVLDNEPRSKDTIQRMDKAINAGCNVVFSKIPTKYKDINNMILGGIDIRTIRADIAKNTYNGSKAKAMLRQWKKI